MNNENLKVYALNVTSFTLSFTNIENGMKLILLMMSIIYTGIMIYKILTNKK